MIKHLLLSLSIACVLLSCSPKQEAPTDNKAETHIFMHNRMGVRIELNIDKKELNLWISPKAGEAIDNATRNFSNRDDHTMLFDHITFPAMELKNFVKCDYNPFHSIVYFSNMTLHIASLTNKPVVMVWIDEGGYVDIKSDKTDTELVRDKNIFALKHADRGFDFNYVALLKADSSFFRHQIQLEPGRSIYAQAYLAPASPLIIAGGLANEKVVETAQQIAQVPIDTLLNTTKNEVAQALQFGKVVLKNKPELQKLIDVNKQIYYSMVDSSGAVRAAIQSIYYMIWVRDGGMASSLLGNSGWLLPIQTWTAFQLANPTIITNEEPKGRMFGQLTNKTINKWEEDGNFYAIWSAFSHWTQTGDRTYVSGQNLILLEDCMDWLERYIYSEKQKAFGRYYYCETCFEGCRDYMFDNAIGLPTLWGASPYKDSTIKQSFDMYINMTAYTNYMMLAAMQTDTARQQYFFNKAANLAPFIQSLYKNNSIPDYGNLLTKNGTIVRATGFGMDETDHMWGLSLPYFYPDFDIMPQIRNMLLQNQTADPRNHFLSGWFSLLASMDVEFANQDSMMWMVDYAAKQSIRPGKYKPMPNTIIEMTDQPDGHPWHDVRPQGFSIASMLAAVNNFAVRRLPFGIAVRANNYVNAIEKYQYQNAIINFNFTGTGAISSVKIDGEQVQNSWVLPHNKIAIAGQHSVEVVMSKAENTSPVLISTTAELLSISNLSYSLKGYGRNSVVFKNLNKKLSVVDSNQQVIQFKTSQKGVYTFVDFNGFGTYSVALN